MINSKGFNIAVVAVGVLLFGGAVVASLMLDNASRALIGVSFAVGIGLFTIGLPKLVMKYCEEKEPEMMKLNQIEVDDERNTMIRNKSKAIAGDVLQWLVMGMFYVAIFLDAPRWIFFALVGVFVVKSVTEMIFNIVYQKRL